MVNNLPELFCYVLTSPVIITHFFSFHVFFFPVSLMQAVWRKYPNSPTVICELCLSLLPLRPSGVNIFTVWQFRFFSPWEQQIKAAMNLTHNQLQFGSDNTAVWNDMKRYNMLWDLLAWLYIFSQIFVACSLKERDIRDFERKFWHIWGPE